MKAQEKEGWRAVLVDKEPLRKIAEAQASALGIIADPGMTVEKVQMMVAANLRAHGIRPEDNIFSCGIIAARDEE